MRFVASSEHTYSQQVAIVHNPHSHFQPKNIHSSCLQSIAVMGRYDLRPARVRQSAAMLLSSKRITQQPPWFQIMHDVPPSEMLVRTQPVQHVDPPKNKKVRKASRLFQPQRIAYQEDKLRQEFFADHPWELARPRVLVENDGKDHQKWDWSKSSQPGRPSNGERLAPRLSCAARGTPCLHAC